MDDPIVGSDRIHQEPETGLFQGDIAQAFFAAVLSRLATADLVSAEHFTVDGTLLEAWASHKSVHLKNQPTRRRATTIPEPHRRLPGGTAEQRHPPVDHGSDSQLIRKSRGQARYPRLPGARPHGEPARRSWWGPSHAGGRRVRTGHRPGPRHGAPGEPPGDLAATRATTPPPSSRAVASSPSRPRGPARNARRGSAIDDADHPSPWVCGEPALPKRVREVFGWLKTVANSGNSTTAAPPWLNWVFLLRTTAYNLIRMRNLLEATHDRGARAPRGPRRGAGGACRT